MIERKVFSARINFDPLMRQLKDRTILPLPDRVGGVKTTFTASNNPEGHTIYEICIPTGEWMRIPKAIFDHCYVETNGK